MKLSVPKATMLARISKPMSLSLLGGPASPGPVLHMVETCPTDALQLMRLKSDLDFLCAVSKSDPVILSRRRIRLRRTHLELGFGSFAALRMTDAR